MAGYNVISQPLQMYYDTDGTPLDAGYIYIGVNGLNPESNPVSVYWDNALTQPALQPIRTLNGYPSRNGTPARLYTSLTDGTYSVIVKNKSGGLVYSKLSSDYVVTDITLTALAADVVAAAASISADEAALAPHYAAIEAVNANATNIDIVAANNTNVTNVGSNITSVIACDTNMAAIIAAPTAATNAQLKAWEAEAERLTADSYATEPEDVFVKVYTSNGNGSFTATPTTEYSSVHWAAKAAASVASIGSLDSLSDVAITTPSSGQSLRYNGSIWVNGLDSLDGLSDATITTPSTGQVLAYNGSQWVNSTISVSAGVRQTVQSASVDTNGLPNFLTVASTSSIAVAATAKNIVINAAGGTTSSDRIGIITADTTITGLSTSAISYLYADVAANGTCACSGTTVNPNYQMGGTPATTNGLFTFNYGEMKGYLGNGSTAPQGWRVYLGETVLGNYTTLDILNDSSGKALYQFENNANDTSGNYNGTATNVTYGTGKFGSYGAVFNGTTSKFTAPILAGMTAWTITGWFNMSTWAASGVLAHFFSSLASPTSGSIAIDNNAGTVRINKYGVAAVNLTAATNLANSVWHFMMVKWDGTNVTVDIDKGTYSNSISYTATGQNNFALGCYADGTGFTASTLDQFRVFNKALSNAERDSVWAETGAGIVGVTNYALNGFYDSGDFSTTAVSTTKNHNIGVYPTFSKLLLGGVESSAAITQTNKTYTWTAASGTSRLIGKRGW